ncbi:MAG: hypothetical protein ABFC62_10255 [Clostridiaceae bacterium]
MRCSCRVCGAYMVQSERGLSSGCRCPECLNECSDCMGTIQTPLTAEELKKREALFLSREREEEQ